MKFIVLLFSSALLLMAMLSSCMKWDYRDDPDSFEENGYGLFIICEGNFQYGNASLSFYNPESNNVENEIFYRANGMKLGDVAQSMTMFENKGWIVVNNSHVVFAIDANTFKEIGRIENLTSPRYIHFVSDRKAYITQIWDNRIFIVDPSSYSVIGHITVPDMPLSSGSTEQMVQIGKYVYCNCWSYQNKIIKIDSETDEVVDFLEVGIQPNSLVKDKYDRLWTITDGGYENSPYGHEAPALYCIDSSNFNIIRIYNFTEGDSPSEIKINGSGDTLFWINDDVWKMGIEAPVLPKEPFLPYHNTKYYGLTINPENDEVYVADAIDYSQQGMIYRFSKDGSLIDSFYTGITPGAFCWK